MKIGIDISSLQSAHRLRGIGYTAANLLRNIDANSTDTFVFYADKVGIHSLDDILDELRIAPDQYKLRYFKRTLIAPKLPGKLRLI